MRVRDLNWMQLEDYLELDDRNRPSARLHRAARLPVARDRQPSRRARCDRGRRSRSASPCCRCSPTGWRRALLPIPGVPRSPSLVRGGAVGSAGFAARPGVRPRADRQRARREQLRRRAGSQRMACAGTTGGAASGSGRSSTRSIPTRATRPGWRASRGRGSPASRSRTRTSRLWTVQDAVTDPAEFRRLAGDGSFGGFYERPEGQMLEIWDAAVDEVRVLLDSGWTS